MKNSVVVESAEPHMDVAGGTVAQSATVAAENAATVAAGVDKGVTVTVYVQQQAADIADVIALMNLWLNSVSVGIAALSAIIVMVTLLFAFFGVKKYRDIELWRQQMETSVYAHIDKRFDTLKGGFNPSFPRFLLNPQKRGNNDDHD